MRVYIAGPMSGLPDSNYPLFNETAARWRAAGWDVENPAEHFGGSQDRTYPEYVNADIVVLAACDAIAMLPNWDAGHSGAIWEHAIAVHLLKIPVYDALQPHYLTWDAVRNAGRRVGKSAMQEEYLRNFVNEAIPCAPPLTRHPITGALGRWSY